MPTTWTLRLHLPSPSPYPVTPGQLNGLACALTEHPDSDHTAQTKPFSISPLFQDNHAPDHRVLRVGWLDDDNPLDLTHLRGRRIRLGNNTLTTTDIRRDHTPYAALLDHPPTTRARFTFHSATYFKSSGRHVPVPDPKLLFPGLLRRWNTYASVPITRDQTDGFVQSIAVTAHDIRTVPVTLQRAARGARTGFLGTVTFTLTAPAPATAPHVFPALCHLAATAGTGAQTTHGLGHTQVHLHPATAPATAPAPPPAEASIPARGVSARQPRRGGAV